MFIDDAVVNKHNTLYTNDNINVTIINQLVMFSDSNHFTTKIYHRSNIANNITRHNHNNYEHNVIQQVIV